MAVRYVRNKGFCDPCRKVAWGSPSAAERTARNRNRHEDKHDPVRVYRCPAGNGWHIGHQ